MFRVRQSGAGVALLVIGLGALLAASLAGCASTASMPAGTPTATTLPAGTVLYQGDWAQGLAAWHATDGFKADGNYLLTDGGSERSLTIPYQPTVANFAVQFQVQVVSIPKGDEGTGYFRLAAQAQSGKDSWIAAVEAINNRGATNKPELSVSIDPPDGDHPTITYSVHDYDPHTILRTYRVEVRDNFVMCYVDDVANGTAHTVRTPALSHGPLTFTTGQAVVRLSNFTVTAL